MKLAKSTKTIPAQHAGDVDDCPEAHMTESDVNSEMIDAATINLTDIEKENFDEI